MCPHDHFNGMLKSIQDADNAWRNMARAQQELDEVNVFWTSGALKCEVVYNSLVRSYARSIEVWAGVVKTYDDNAATYRRLLIQSGIPDHRAYLDES